MAKVWLFDIGEPQVCSKKLTGHIEIEQFFRKHNIPYAQNASHRDCGLVDHSLEECLGLNRAFLLEQFGEMPEQITTEILTPKDDYDREHFLQEHWHDTDESRLFLSGQAVFYLHLGEMVAAVLFEANDFFTLPAKTCHWFDAGSAQSYTSIQFSNSVDRASHDVRESLGALFPKYEALLEI